MNLVARLNLWLQRNMPKREHLEANRFVRPFAERQELWRFTRRSVPRGVAAGLLVGIFAMIPGIQIIGAVLLCVPCRGNIPIAAAMTFLSNPATTPFILAAALFVGNSLGFQADLATFKNLYTSEATLRDWSYWMLSDAAPALVIGLAIIAVVAAAIGYLAAIFFWRAWVGRKHRARLRRPRSMRDREQ